MCLVPGREEYDDATLCVHHPEGEGGRVGDHVPELEVYNRLLHH